ncbi:alpha/beta-hydrolase [Periconia macrospinosa]|uniref:Alpha/beta-hydrolase n=1 Tax=Periconia macrospinosa TaxID=97972 RepID=A0A2V1EGA4_9PLEO|nr:alpha/beta-hydrolase [Periconia macrospinosa]
MVFLNSKLAVGIMATYMLAAAATKEGQENGTDAEGCIGKGQNALASAYYPPNGVCSDFYVPLSLDYEGPEWNASRWNNAFELQDFLSTATASARAGYPLPLGPMKRFQGNYEIAATFCTPRTPKDGKEKTVIVATHGIGPGREHWNSPYRPDEFNFVKHSLSKGYSVFFYDRLGCGASSRLDGFEASVFTAKTVLQQLASLVRKGKYTGKIKAEKVAVIGFSFGSYATHAAVAEKPEIADAVIMTGIGFNTTGINGNGLLRSFVPRIAALENPSLFGDRNPGYLTWPSVYDLVMNYFKAPNFDQDVALYTESAKQPFSIVEFLTFAGPAEVSADKWDKPALHITGELDYIVADGTTKGVIDHPAREIYKNAKPLQISVHPGASHHLNFARNATGAFEVITSFLSQNGV